MELQSYTECLLLVVHVLLCGTIVLIGFVIYIVKKINDDYKQHKHYTYYLVKKLQEHVSDNTNDIEKIKKENLRRRHGDQ